MNSPAGPRPNKFVVPGLLALGVLLRLPAMTESLWFDEIYRTRNVFLYAESLSEILFHDVHNFLYNLALHGWIRVFGDSEISIRLPSLVLGLSSAYLLSRWVGRRFGASFGIVFLAWVVTAPFHIWYSTEAKNVIAVAFFSAWILIAYADFIGSQGARPLMLAIASGVLGICADFLLFLPLAAILVWAVTRSVTGRSRQPLAGVAVAFGSTVAILSPLLIFKYGQLEELTRSYMKPFDVGELALLLFNYLPSGNAIFLIHPYQGWPAQTGAGPRLLLIAIGVGVGALLLKGVIGLARTDAGSLVNFALLVPILSMFGATALAVVRHGDSEHFVYLERSLGSVVFYPFGLVLLGGALSLRRPVLRRGAVAALLALNVLSAVLLLTVHRDEWTVWYPNPDWKGFAAEIEGEPEPALVVTNCPPWAIDYYLRDRPHFARALDELPKSSDLEGAVRLLYAERGLPPPADFYVAANPYMGVPLNPDALARGHRVLAVKNYRGLVVYRLAFSGGAVPHD